MSEIKTRVETISRTPAPATGPAGVSNATGSASASGATGSASALPPDDAQRPYTSSSSTGGPSGTPRLSRLAIVGAAWAPFFLLTAVFWLSPSDVQTGTPLPVSPLQQMLQAIGIFFAIIVLASGVTAPFGATILGAISISQIRHSAGRLYGLGLALFDALLFPLLLLDAVIVLLPTVVLCIFLTAPSEAPGGGPHVVPIRLGVFLFVLLATLLALGIDYLIVRWAWRALKRPVGDTFAAGSARLWRPCRWLRPCSGCHWLRQCFCISRRTTSQHVSSKHWQSQWHTAKRHREGKQTRHHGIHLVALRGLDRRAGRGRVRGRDEE